MQGVEDMGLGRDFQRLGAVFGLRTCTKNLSHGYGLGALYLGFPAKACSAG